MPRAIASLLLLGLLSGFPARPQQPLPRKGRPSIGLVLAGGGALGLAHTGVIQWLEENRIPVDYIAGTSMGGLVGGLYATGYSAAEIEQFFEQVDWPEALQINTPFRDLSFRRKEDRREFPNALEFGLKGALKLPPGLSPGQGVGLVISRAAAPYGVMKSFDDLPIPFRCVATDLVAGEEVDFSSGSLFEALRATMSLPAIFAPVRSGNRVLVDGGLLNNLPIEVAKRMGADVIIAVGIETPLGSDSGYDNLLAVARRSIGLVVTANENRNLKSLGEADLILLPNLTGFSAGSFDKSKELAERGYQEAKRKARFLEVLSVSPEEWKEIVAAREARRRPTHIDPKFVQVKDSNLARDEYWRQRLDDAVFPKLNRKELENTLTEITGLGRYEAADYIFQKDENGQEGVVVQLHEKSYGPPFLNTGIFVNGSNAEGLKLGVGARLTFMDLLLPGSEWRTDGSLGTDNQASSEFYYRLKDRRFFVAPSGFFTQRSQNYYANGNRALYSYKVREAGGMFDVGFAPDRFSEIRLGYKVSRLHTFVTSGNPELRPLSGMVGSTNLRYVRDTMDSIVPTAGLYLNVNGQWVNRWPGATKSFPLAETRFAWARKIGEQYSFLDIVAGGTTGGTAAGFPPFTLGGPMLLTSLAKNQFIGYRYYYNGAYLMRSLSKEKLSFLSRFRAMIGYEFGNPFLSGNPHRPFSDGVIGLIGETGIGVVSFGGSVGERGERKVFISVGRFF